ncbi:MAG TPA: hypothetical protein VN914_18625, partial [Polyangia bacterium]|nr:hypothetical protein [Polyangia bacterium]
MALRSAWLLTTVCLASCATAGSVGGGGGGGGDGRQVGSPAPEITVQRMSGKSVSVSSYRGQV